MSLPVARLVRSPGSVWLVALVACACGGGGRQAGDPATKFFSVHNALLVSGMTQQGGVNRGHLAQGQVTRLPMDLPALCATVVALGGGEIGELEMQLADSEGKVVAKDETRGPDATVRYCVERPGKYELHLKAGEGQGAFLVSTWAGGQAPPSADGGPGQAQGQTGAGTCESPIVLVPGQSYVGDTDDGRSLEESTGCGSSNARELVYRMEVPMRQRIVLDLDAQFDAVLFVRKGDCGDRDAEVACNDDSGNPRRSKVDETFEPGTYYVFVDGLRNEEGRFRLATTVQAAASASLDACEQAPLLTSSGAFSGDLAGKSDHYQASCGRGAHGPEMAHRFELPIRSRVRFTAEARGAQPVVYLKSSCGEDAEELGCDDGQSPGRSELVSVLDAGTYWVFADSPQEQNAFRYMLSAETAPEGGMSVRGDTCGDAEALGAIAGTLEPDTFAARDDLTASCGGAGTPDVVYRLDLGRRSYVSAAIASEGNRRVLALQKTCGDRASEVGCGSQVRGVLAPGTWFLVVDGASESLPGRARLSWRVEDLTGAEVACKAAMPIAGEVSGTTKGGANRFGSSCTGALDTQDSADRVFRFSVQQKTEMLAQLTTSGFTGALSLRKACADPTSEVACTIGYHPGQRVAMHRYIDPGTYYLIVDGRGLKAEGDFAVKLDLNKVRPDGDRSRD